jgi:RHS repeat-associated protein
LDHCAQLLLYASPRNLDPQHTAYSYDGFSRLIEVSDTVAGQATNPLGQTLTYDALDRVRTTSTSLVLPGQQTQLVKKTSLYRGIAEELVESNTSVNLTGDITSIDANYALAPDGVLAQRDSVTTPLGAITTSLELIGSGPHQDVTYLTRMNGQVVGSKAYDPWGEMIAESGVESSDLGFQSDPTDENTGLVDMGARHYLPELGRFLTEDPAGDGVNHYAYGGNDPVSMWDPTGLSYAPAGPNGNGKIDKDEQRRSDAIEEQSMSSAGDFRRTEAEVQMAYVPPLPPYGGEGDPWLIRFFGGGFQQSGDQPMTRVGVYLDGIGVNFVKEKAEVMQWSPGSEHYYVKASYTFDQLSGYDVQQRGSGGFYYRDIDIDVSLCGSSGSCVELKAPKDLECVGMECGRYPTMVFTGYAERSEIEDPKTVEATARVFPIPLLLQAPSFVSHTIQLQPDYSVPFYHQGP